MTLRSIHMGDGVVTTTTTLPARDLKVGQRVAYRHRNDPGNAFAYWLRVVEPHGRGGLSVVQERDLDAEPFPYMVEADDLLEVEVPL